MRLSLLAEQLVGALIDRAGKPIFASDRPNNLALIDRWGQKGFCRGVSDDGVLYLFDSDSNTHDNIVTQLGLDSFSSRSIILSWDELKLSSGNVVPVREARKYFSGTALDLLLNVADLLDD